MINQKGIIFDMDGTITKSQSLHYKSYAKVFKDNGINYTIEEDQTMYAGKGAERTFRETFLSRGVILTEPEIKNLALKKRELYMKLIKKSKIEIIPGIKEFVESSLKKGKKIIIATGSNHIAVNYLLVKSNLKKYFPQVLASSDVKNPKPAPDIFLLAAKKIGLKTTDCVVIEDASMGIKAAKSAGMYCIGIATTLTPDQLKKAGADMVINDYNDLMN